MFIWCFNLQNGQLRKVTIHIFESHKSPQYGTFLDFRLPYGGDKLLLEKENIWTFDAKGELLITIMSSLAQEESRSVSENCKWRLQEKMKQGELVGLRGMYGYTIGKNSVTIQPDQAETVRRIFQAYISGNPVSKLPERL